MADRFTRKSKTSCTTTASGSSSRGTTTVNRASKDNRGRIARRRKKAWSTQVASQPTTQPEILAPLACTASVLPVEPPQFPDPLYIITSGIGPDNTSLGTSEISIADTINLWANNAINITTTVGVNRTLVTFDIDFADLTEQQEQDLIAILGPIASAHNSLTGIQGGALNNYYHLTQNQYNTLTSGSNADLLHVHDANAITGLALVATSGDHSNLLNIGTNTHVQIDGHIADATIHFTDASVLHNNRSDLQGGTVGEYYHLTSAEYSQLQAGTLPQYWDRDTINGRLSPSTLTDKVGIGTSAPGGLLGLSDANTYLDVDGSTNLTFTDAVTGTLTLADIDAKIDSIGDTIGSATQGSVLFAGASGVLSQDNTGLNYSSTYKSLGIGKTASATVALSVESPTLANLLTLSDSVKNVFSVASNGYMNLQSDVAFYPQIVTTASADSNGGAYVTFRKSRGSTATKTIVNNGDTVGTFIGQGYDGTAFYNAAYFSFKVDGVPGAGFIPGKIDFYVTDTSGVTRNRMAIRQSGNIGIGGTVSPTARFHITGAGATSATTTLLVENSGATQLFTVRDDGLADFNTAIKKKYRSVTATGNVNLTDHILYVDATLGNVTLTLPTAASGDGYVFIIKRLASDVSVNTVTVDGNGVETIDNVLTQSLLAGDSITIQSDGTEWHII